MAHEGIYQVEKIKASPVSRSHTRFCPQPKTTLYGYIQVGNPLGNQGKKPPTVFVVINVLRSSAYPINATICELIKAFASEYGPGTPVK
jgi:hypothetical protein